FFIDECMINKSALSLPNTLRDYLLGSLCGDPSEIAGCYFNFDDIVDRKIWVNLPSGIKRDFHPGIEHFIHDRLPCVHANDAGESIDIHSNILCRVEIPLIAGNK